MPRQATSPFTPQARDLIRLELMPRFGQDPDLANGLFLRTWRDGPKKGQPKIPKAIQSMLDRGLVRIGTNPMGRATAFFTVAGLEGLRLLLRDRRVMDEERFGYLRLRVKDEAGEPSPACRSCPRYTESGDRLVLGSAPEVSCIQMQGADRTT
jgi:hypothetical protein